MPRKLLLVFLLPALPLVLFFFPLPAHAVFVIAVNSHSDVLNPSDNLCTLREAVIAVNTHSPSGGGGGECPGTPGLDTIVLPSGTFPLTISGSYEDNSLTGDLDITQTMTIQGNGSGCLVNLNCTAINANLIDRVFDITSTAHVTITKLDIMLGNSFGADGGGIRNYGGLVLNDVYFSNNSSMTLAGALSNESGGWAMLDTVGFVLNHSDGFAGAISNAGTMTLTNTLFTWDTAQHNGGALANTGIATVSDSLLAYETVTTTWGGGIWNHGLGNLTLNRVTLYDNQSIFGSGGGIVNQNMMTLTNVTLSSNSANQGGAIYADGGNSTLTNVTVYSNTATSGGGIYNNAGSISLKNTIVTNSPSGGNCAGSAITSLGYNFDGRDTCAFSAIGDITFTVALLGPLAYNGGTATTFTHALLPGSPAINKIPFGTNGCGTAITTDQRGYARIAPCDIGAFEYVLRGFLPLILK